MTSTRRDFLKHSSSAMIGAAGLSALPAWAQNVSYGSMADPQRPQKPTLVVLYLRGGADPLSTIIPGGDAQYYAARPTIAVPGPANGSEENPAMLPITDYFGMHPAMSELKGLYDAGVLAPIISAGSTHPTRSHFDAQDFMERAAPGIKTITEGWLNRYLYTTKSEHDSELRAVSLQPTLPRSLRGQYSVLAVPEYGVEQAMDVFHALYSCEGDLEALKAMQADTNQSQADGDAAMDPAERNRRKIVQTGEDGIRKLRFLNQLIRNQAQTGAQYPGGHLSNQFRDLARVIKANVGLEVAAIDYNGWDHHAYQGGSTGTMANMLRNVSRTLKAFYDDMGPRMSKTMVLVMSEFGRNVRENGNNGTDHGRAGFMMAMGGMVKGGQLYGRWTGLDTRTLVDGRDLPVHVDFRWVFAETLRNMFGFDCDKHDFFPRYSVERRMLGFSKPMEKT